MGKRHLLVLTVASALVLTPAAVAQTTLDARVSVTPKAGGTPKRPQGHKITVETHLTTPEGVVRPTLTGIEVWYGRGIEFRRKGVPTCSVKTLSEGGPEACPPESRLGAGSGPNADDGLNPIPKLHFFSAPGGKMIAYATLLRPARVRAVLDDRPVLDAPGPWPFRDAWAFPRTLQVVAGIPITIDDLRLAFGYTKGAKNYISSTSCPRGGWAWRVRLHTWTAPGGAAALTANGRAPCTATR